MCQYVVLKSIEVERLCLAEELFRNVCLIKTSVTKSWKEAADGETEKPGCTHAPRRHFCSRIERELTRQKQSSSFLSFVSRVLSFCVWKAAAVLSSFALPAFQKGNALVVCRVLEGRAGVFWLAAALQLINWPLNLRAAQALNLRRQLCRLSFAQKPADARLMNGC